MDKRQKLKFLKFRGAKLSFAQKTLIPFPLFAAAPPPPPPCWRRPVRRGRGHCPRLQVARPLGSLPLQVGAPAGAAAFAGGSARESAPAGGAVSLAAAPAGFLPVGAAATGAATLRCLSPRCCPAAPLPAGSVAAGASTERAASPAGRKPAASRPSAGCCRHSACACAGAVLPAFGCAARTQIEGSNYCCPFSLLRQRF